MNEKILIVDDEKDVCDALKEALEYEGYEVSISISGDEAIGLIKGRPFDLLLVDVRLEGRTSGVEVIRQCQVEFKRPLIFIISATPKSSLEAMFKQCGLSGMIDQILEKPSDVNPIRLTKLIRERLDKRREERGYGG